MGLNERRKIKELQDVTLPARVLEIQEICGKAIPYEVDWDSLPSVIDYEALERIARAKGVETDEAALRKAFAMIMRARLIAMKP